MVVILEVGGGSGQDLPVSPSPSRGAAGSELGAPRRHKVTCGLTRTWPGHGSDWHGPWLQSPAGAATALRRVMARSPRGTPAAVTGSVALGVQRVSPHSRPWAAATPAAAEKAFSSSSTFLPVTVCSTITVLSFSSPFTSSTLSWEGTRESARIQCQRAQRYPQP